MSGNNEEEYYASAAGASTIPFSNAGDDKWNKGGVNKAPLHSEAVIEENDEEEEGGQEEEEEEDPNTMKAFVLAKMDKFFVDHLPIESFAELPPAYMYYFGTVAYMAAIALFVYFTYTSYNANRNTAFISLSTDDGECSEVAISVTGSYLADDNGNWVGTEDFVYSDSPYQLVLNSFHVADQDKFKEMMQTFRDSLDYIGSRAKEHDLAWNLVAWVSYLRYYDTKNPSKVDFGKKGHGELQYLQMTGDAQEIFDLSYFQIHFGTEHGICDYSAFTSFDQANGVIAATFNHSEYVTRDHCLESLALQAFGYVDEIEAGQFSVSLEVRSFMTALGVNLGLADLSNLEVAGSTTTTITSHQGITYQYGEYFDTRYPDMDAINCLKNTTVIPAGTEAIETLCFLSYGVTAALPILHVMGDLSQPRLCDCSADNADYSQSRSCQDFNLLAGLVFYNDVSDESASQAYFSSVLEVLSLASKFSSYDDFRVAAYNATWAGAAYTFGQYDDVVATESWQENAFQFCSRAGANATGCSLAVFNGVDNLNHKVSTYKYQLQSGSCKNTFTIDSSDWDKLQDNPPVQLTQDYYECYPSTYNAFLDAVGIASGNTSLAVPIIVFLLLPLLYFLLVAINQVPPKQEYTPKEKEEAVEILGTLLLRLRDGKTRGVKRNGVLMRLTQELIKAAKEEGGFPDSDDEEEDDDYADNYHNSPTHLVTSDGQASNVKRRSSANRRVGGGGCSSGGGGGGGVPGGGSPSRPALRRGSSTNTIGSNVSFRRRRRSSSRRRGARGRGVDVDSDDEREEGELDEEDYDDDDNDYYEYDYDDNDDDDDDDDDYHDDDVDAARRSGMRMKQKSRTPFDGNTNRRRSSANSVGAGRRHHRNGSAVQQQQRQRKRESAGAGQSGSKPRRRKAQRAKLGLFTKHIESGTSGTAGSAGNMEQQLRKRPSSRETSKSSKPGSRDGSSDAAAGNGVIGYLFGSWGGAADGSGNGTGNEARHGANVREHEMVPYSATANPLRSTLSRQPSKRRSSFLDPATLRSIMDEEDVPKDIQVMNMGPVGGGMANRASDGKSKFTRIPSPQEVDVWVDDLVQLFTEALAQTSDAAPGSSLQQQQTQAPQDDPEAGTVASSVRGRGSVVGGMSTKYTKGAAAETFAFKQAQTLAAKLVMVDINELFDRFDPTVFLKLSNALCLHASIEMRCAMRDVALQYADLVAYNVGGKLLTVANLNTAMK